MNNTIPQPVLDICQSLSENGYNAYPVGGCVRDLFLGRIPKDWDITTDATPEQVQSLFPDSFYENDFGTVGVKTTVFLASGKEKREHDVVEVTTHRTEFGYSDKRRPDEVRFAKTVEEDLARRDFTINAMALKVDKFTSSAPAENGVIDPFGGLTDLKAGILRTVGNPNERFAEDALRLMRAVRFAGELGFTIDQATFDAIRNNAPSLGEVSWERIRIEFERIILSDRPSEGVDILQKTGLLRHVIPELEEGVGVTQNLHHVYTVWEHNLLALKTCPSKKLAVRLAALLHDVGKPRTKRGDGKYATFYNHDHVGARMTRKILDRLRFPREIVEKATLLVDQHLFYYNVDEVTEAAVRRVIKRVGLENIRDLIDVRIGDRLGSGVPKAKPYRLRHFEFMVEKVSKDALSVKKLAINGHDLMNDLGMKPGPKIGAILDVLLGEVIDNAAKNNHEYLLRRSKDLIDVSLDDLRSTAKKRIEDERREEEESMKRKYWV